jgi:hypothetical protein
MNPKTCLTNVAGRDVAFIHIPKTGGQSVQRALKMGLRRHLPVTHPARRNEIMSASYAFAFVRHPHSWATSLFYWFAELHLTATKRRPENAAMNQWCRNTDINTFWMNVDVPYLNRQMTGNMFRQQSWFLTMRNGRLHPKVKVLRFERMADEWEGVCDDLGVDIKLPHHNSTRKADRCALNDDAKARIAELYHLDFTNFYPPEK